MSKDLPKGYRIDVGGTVEESAQSQASVFDKVPLMLLLMVVFLMAQLHSFSRLALVLSVVPMGLIGIVIALLVFGQPLGFVAILGILALFGMIARNAVILIEQIETERASKTTDLGRRGRSDPVALSADHAHGDFNGARIYSDRSNRVLGTDAAWVGCSLQRFSPSSFCPRFTLHGFGSRSRRLRILRWRIHEFAHLARVLAGIPIGLLSHAPEASDRLISASGRRSKMRTPLID